MSEKRKQPKGNALSVRLPPPVKAALEKAAQDDRRTVSNFVELILADALRERGYLK